MKHFKNVFYSFIFVLFSCSSSNDKNADNAPAIDFKKLDTIIPFSGYWVSEQYFNNILKFKSPKKSQDSSLCIFIPERTRMNTLMIYNFHEGGPTLQLIKNKNDYELWDVQDDTLKKRMHKIKVIAKNKITIDNLPFVNVNLFNKQDEYWVLEEILFKGKYKTPDKKIVEFKQNREVVGIPKIKYYKPAIDYYGEALNIDQIGLGESENNIEWFGFKFKHDTLELYILVERFSEKTGPSVSYGQLNYRLIKVE